MRCTSIDAHYVSQAHRTESGSMFLCWVISLKFGKAMHGNSKLGTSGMSRYVHQEITFILTFRLFSFVNPPAARTNKRSLCEHKVLFSHSNNVLGQDGLLLVTHNCITQCGHTADLPLLVAWIIAQLCPDNCGHSAQVHA